MRWHHDSITQGEIEALHQAAQRAWADDTRYPIAHVTSPDSGQCYVTALWLKERLGGQVGKLNGHFAWLSPDSDFVLDLATHTGHIVYEENTSFAPYEAAPNGRTERFARRANRIFEHLSKVLHLSLDYMGDPLPASEPQRSTEIAQENDQGGSQTDQYWHDEPAWEPSQGQYKFVYCNPGESPIWMSDLSFRRIENVKVGDKVVGWDRSGSYDRRKLCESTVLEIFERTAEVVKVTFESGRKISCTADHRWLRHWSQGASNSGEQFVTPAPGELLTHVIDVDKADPILLTRYSRDAAWLGGIFDGEGSVQMTIKLSQCPDHNPEIRGRIKRSLERLGFEYTDGGVKDIWIKGGREEFVKFANWTDPVRRDKIAKLALGERWQTPDRIVSVEPEGTDTVYGMKTTTGNYVAWGYASKNCNGQLEISPFHDHEQLLAHTGVGKDHAGPMAIGHATLNDNKATWEVQSNMNVKGLDRIFKEYTKKVGWDWGGITNIEGEPISDDFAPKASSTLYWIYDEHLWIGRDTPAGLAIRTSSFGQSAQSGTVTIEGSRAFVSPVVERSIPSLYEWAEDSGLRLYAGNDNQLKVIPDLQEDNLYDPEFKNPDDRQFFPGAPDEREPSGVYKCPVCRRLFPGWDEYQGHRKREAEDAGEINEGPSGFPEVEESAIQDSHFTPQQPEVFSIAKVAGMTGPQRQRAVENADQIHPDTSQAVHKFPNGWSIRKLQTYGDKDREGKLMANCWQSPWAGHPAWSDWDQDGPPDLTGKLCNVEPLNPDHTGGWSHYSLRDEYNYPHVSFHVQEPNAEWGELGRATNAFGHGNSAVKPEHSGMIGNWASQNGIQWEPQPLSAGDHWE